MDGYDPMADVIAGNQESIIRVYREAMRRALSALNAGDVRLAKRTIEAANTYHPMHEESWCGWPEPQEGRTMSGAEKMAAIDRAVKNRERVRDAAPALLAALREAVDCLEHDEPPKGGWTERVLRRCRAALAAAEPATGEGT